MIVVITIVTGIVLGFATSSRTPTDGFEDLTRNVVVGMAGAFVGLQVAARIFDSGEAGTSAIALTIAATTGAAILLFIVNSVRRA
jgi:uncharacterized membrane protein YeaQ/YmgE (transglycosylase-associated protein family)